MRNVIRSTIWDGEVFYTRARIILDTGSALTSSDATRYDVNVFDVTGGGTSSPQTSIYSTSSAATSTVIYGAYRTSGWTQDSTGYNVELIGSATALNMAGGHVYRLVLSLVTTDYGNIQVVHDVTVRPLLTV